MRPGCRRRHPSRRSRRCRRNTSRQRPAQAAPSGPKPRSPRTRRWRQVIFCSICPTRRLSASSPPARQGPRSISRRTHLYIGRRAGCHKTDTKARVTLLVTLMTKGAPRVNTWGAFSWFFAVDLRGFEPLTPSMRTRCATGLRHRPLDVEEITTGGDGPRNPFLRVRGRLPQCGASAVGCSGELGILLDVDLSPRARGG